MIKFGTKAETLEKLRLLNINANVLPQIRFTVKEWENSSELIMKKLDANEWNYSSLIVRSSAVSEDSSSESLAGHFLSVADVSSKSQLEDAIIKVIASFKEYNEKDQIFIQPMLKDVIFSGVAFSRDPNTGGHYIVINYDDYSGTTDSVTSGSSNDAKVFYYYKEYDNVSNGHLSKVITMVKELEQLFNQENLDIEFAITKDKMLYLLQVRPLCINEEEVKKESQKKVLENIYEKIRKNNCPHPYLYGSRTVFGVMPDWNPAEIIGIRPRPLALSLYKEMVTDNIWAYQRKNYGYKNLRSFPLMISFFGLPYIDVRVSFNSFLPADLDNKLCEKLTNYYIDRLIEKPSNHDKVEFEIIFSCYTMDLPMRIKELTKYGFNEDECLRISNSLKKLTNNIIDSNKGLWQKDIEKIEELETRRKTILNSSLDKVSKIYWLMEDCKRYGTLPFAGLARAGFIAVQILKSLVNIGVLNDNEYENFMCELDTVSSKMTMDFENLNPKTFIKKYGHLRPGTYDILSPRYDEAPERYFDWDKERINKDNKNNTFTLSLKQLNKIKELLKEHNLVYDVLGLFEFIKIAIEGREYSKFVFTKSLSDAMDLFKQLGVANGFSIEDCSYADISIIKELYSSSENVKEVLNKSIQLGKEKYKYTKQISLPPLIIEPEEVWAFHLPNFEPNFITLKKAIGNVTSIKNDLNKIKDSILFIPNADPGYDWIFSHGIKGLITMYGGVNSHMAIRAGELGIPAVIGVGEQNYKNWINADILELNCANKKVRILK